MVEPFRSDAPPRGGLVRRLRGRSRAHLERELWRLLGSVERVRDVAPDRIDRLCARNGALRLRDLDDVRTDLYRRFLEHCLLDCALSADERAELAHLRLLLRVSEQEAEEVHDRVAKAVYGTALDRVLEDHRCDPEEEDFLRRLREDLRLPGEVAERLRERAARRARDRFVSGAAVHENVYLTSRDAIVELEGSSDASLDEAMRDAVARGCETLAELEEAELAEARVVLEDGAVVEWRVKLRAGVPREESGGT